MRNNFVSPTLSEVIRESYKAAQIFEAVGLADEVVDRCFTGTASRIGGAGFAEIAQEIAARYSDAYPAREENPFDEYRSSGDYHVRFGGEKHMWDPESIANLQVACRNKDRKAWDAFSSRQNARSTEQATIRGLLKFRDGKTADVITSYSIHYTKLYDAGFPSQVSLLATHQIGKTTAHR